MEVLLTSVLAVKAARILLIVLAGAAGTMLIQRWLGRAAHAYIMRLRSLSPALGGPQQSAEEVAKRAATVAGVLVWTVETVIVLVALGALLGELEINTSAAVAGLSVLGVALGFGAQAVVRDCINGVFILLEDQYRRGDVVRVAGISGLVEEISLRRTVLRDLDGTVHSIPNGEVRAASNLTREWSRANLDIGVAYTEDVDRVTALLDEIGHALAADPHYSPMITEALHFVRVDRFTEFGFTLKVLGVTKPMNQWEVMGEYRRRVLVRFKAEGIELARAPVGRPPALQPAARS